MLCTTTVSGQTPLSDSAPLAGGAAGLDAELELLVQALAASASASASAPTSSVTVRLNRLVSLVCIGLLVR